MGNGTSYEMPDIQLKSLDQSVASINPRFAPDELLKLQRKENGLHPVSFNNMQTGAVRFTLNYTLLSSRLTLSDCGNVAAANCCSKTFDAKPLYYVRIGSEHDGDAAFVIHAHFRSGLKTEVHATFTDRVTHEQYELGFEGYWRKHTAYFWLARGSGDSSRVPVAKVFCPDGVSQDEYRIDIAPHMDAALIVMVCAILDEQKAQEERTYVY